MHNPVILLMDGDSGAKATLKLLSSKFKKNTAASQPFIHACGNLYVVTTPAPEGKDASMIEDCFKDETKAVKIDGKSFKPDKLHGDNENYYHKLIFAKYVESHAEKIDFSGFSDLLSRITSAIGAYTNSLYVDDAEPQSVAEALKSNAAVV